MKKLGSRFFCSISIFVFIILASVYARENECLNCNGICSAEYECIQGAPTPEQKIIDQGNSNERITTDYSDYYLIIIPAIVILTVGIIIFLRNQKDNPKKI